MIREINDSLRRTGGKEAVNRYNIDQIKEKWGVLHWYDSYSTTEVCKIIQKYEEISEHTCIICGKPATVRTTGWICPYCDDCIPKKEPFIHFGHTNGPKWYGWEGNIDSIPEEKWEEEEDYLNETYGKKE